MEKKIWERKIKGRWISWELRVESWSVYIYIFRERINLVCKRAYLIFSLFGRPSTLIYISHIFDFSFSFTHLHTDILMSLLIYISSMFAAVKGMNPHQLHQSVVGWKQFIYIICMSPNNLIKLCMYKIAKLVGFLFSVLVKC